MAFTPPPAQPLTAAPVQLPTPAPATMMAPPMQTQTPNLASALAKTGGGGSSGGSGSASSSLGQGGSSLGGKAGADSKGNAADAKAQATRNTQAGKDSNAADKESFESRGGVNHAGDPNRYDESGNLRPEDAYSANTSQTAAGAQGENTLMGSGSDQTGDLLGNYLDNISGSNDLFGAGASGNGTGDGWDTSGNGSGDPNYGGNYDNPDWGGQAGAGDPQDSGG